MSNIVKIKRGLAANLSNAGVVDGELKYATDENELYIGDGKKNIKIGLLLQVEFYVLIKLEIICNIFIHLKIMN